MKTKFACKLLVAMAVALSIAHSSPAQEIPDKFKDYPLVYADTVERIDPTLTTERRDSILSPLQVVTNKFGRNWFVFATGGVHTFRGDYSSDGSFKGTLSPDWGVGIGKWFTPGVALKVEFIQSNSRGYTEYLTGHYGYGQTKLTDDNTPYRKMKTRWWDISASAVLNLTRLIYGYEGYYSPKRMNQFMFSAGIGGVHHLGYGHSYGSDNEWSGHLELQYSRFFNRAKRFSLDVKARGLFYQTNFDLEYGQADHAAYKWDSNLGIDIGFTFYIDRARSNGWGHSAMGYYQRDYRERNILQVLAKEGKSVKYKTLTFYVFYPNNYSGRNDAPQIASADVNALDYLAGGIFTQKKYASNGDVASRLSNGQSPIGLKTQDLPTERADQDFEINYVPRGYEMCEQPLSLSLDADDMIAFREKAGFYYAPIYDGLHTWRYRIDDATLKQQLVSDDNYAETQTFGLNAHRGLPTVRSNMKVEEAEELVSFADMYAAMNSYNGYVAEYADSATVARVRNILDNGSIVLIQAEGLATSQDNYSGKNAAQVGQERNTALSQNRAQTVISWLKSNERLNDVSSQIFMVGSLNGSVRTVTDKSTRGLNAKLNRCVKVKIHYMIDK